MITFLISHFFAWGRGGLTVVQQSQAGSLLGGFTVLLRAAPLCCQAHGANQLANNQLIAVHSGEISLNLINLAKGISDVSIQRKRNVHIAVSFFSCMNSEQGDKLQEPQNRTVPPLYSKLLNGNDWFWHQPVQMLYSKSNRSCHSHMKKIIITIQMQEILKEPHSQFLQRSRNAHRTGFKICTRDQMSRFITHCCEGLPGQSNSQTGYKKVEHSVAHLKLSTVCSQALNSICAIVSRPWTKTS